jgi:hypothetical protein
MTEIPTPIIVKTKKINNLPPLYLANNSTQSSTTDSNIKVPLSLSSCMSQSSSDIRREPRQKNSALIRQRSLSPPKYCQNTANANNIHSNIMNVKEYHSDPEEIQIDVDVDMNNSNDSDGKLNMLSAMFNKWKQSTEFLNK